MGILILFILLITWKNKIKTENKIFLICWVFIILETTKSNLHKPFESDIE